MTAYRHFPPEFNDIPQLKDYLRRELLSIETSIAQIYQAEILTLVKLSAPPKRLRTGMLVFADGYVWDPGSGRGLYFYDGTWIFLHQLSAFTVRPGPAQVTITGYNPTITGQL